MNPAQVTLPINAVPIIASLDINPMSCSLSKSLYFFGNMGSTKYLISAVESHTLTLVLFGNVTPNSDKHFLGSLTTRDLYASDLYQVGGMPSSGQG
jgi:hypothetical protein